MLGPVSMAIEKHRLFTAIKFHRVHDRDEEDGRNVVIYHHLLFTHSMETTIKLNLLPWSFGSILPVSASSHWLHQLRETENCSTFNGIKIFLASLK